MNQWHMPKGYAMKKSLSRLLFLVVLFIFFFFVVGEGFPYPRFEKAPFKNMRFLLVCFEGEKWKNGAERRIRTCFM